MKRRSENENRITKLEDFLKELQRSWEEAKRSITIVKETMKKQFDKKKQNS